MTIRSILRTALASGFIFGMLLPGEARAGAKNRRCHWSDLEERIRGKNISLVLPDGTSVSGKALGVTPEHLTLDVRKTSNSAVQPKGTGTIPAQSVSVLQVDKTGKKWRIICTIAMPVIVAGSILAAAGDLPQSGESGYAAVSAATFASLGGGYLLGWALDRSTESIEIVR